VKKIYHRGKISGTLRTLLSAVLLAGLLTASSGSDKPAVASEGSGECYKNDAGAITCSSGEIVVTGSVPDAGSAGPYSQEAPGRGSDAVDGRGSASGDGGSASGGSDAGSNFDAGRPKKPQRYHCKNCGWKGYIDHCPPGKECTLLKICFNPSLGPFELSFGEDGACWVLKGTCYEYSVPTHCTNQSALEPIPDDKK
jgi:hypothetical protein